MHISEVNFSKMLLKYVLTNEEKAIRGYPMPTGRVTQVSNVDPIKYRYSVTIQENWKSTEWDCLKVYPIALKNIPERDIRVCDRCSTYFVENQNFNVSCNFHFGKRTRNNYETVYTCCGQGYRTNGCTIANKHVWRGIKSGNNGPFNDFIKNETVNNEQLLVCGIDCEMAYTVDGLQPTTISLVNYMGEQIYNTLIIPTSPITDYNTRFSGISEVDYSLRSWKTLNEVQQDIFKYIGPRTIIIGHAINNDLICLKLLHDRVVDTSFVFPHVKGGLHKRSLKDLVYDKLNRHIQTPDKPHCGYEDSKATIDLMRYKIDSDLNNNRSENSWYAIDNNLGVICQFNNLNVRGFY